jgi:predicted dehydrogenase
MDWHEGFQVYGEFGSVLGKVFNPWYLRSSEVECFSVKDGQYRRVLGQDAGVYRLQLEGFADAVLKGNPVQGDVGEGIAAMQAMVAIAHSVETGEWVRLAEVRGGVG